MDSMMFPEQNRFGISICICNDRGEFVTAKTAVFLGVPSVQEAEVCELGFDKVSIELDGRLVVDVVLSKSNHQTEFGCIFKIKVNSFLVGIRTWVRLYQEWEKATMYVHYSCNCKATTACCSNADS
ncbi:hypothetical protein MTR_1g096740 [Medicago truncatula]|uniref:Uncharacterized protein n=1 Tax=Medicago truncatula TaxID=3880 RepID=A0A072VQ78_MEDTR|nr:hypothetical protein MTR_1g096740 [Medicago truncatula]